MGYYTQYKLSVVDIKGSKYELERIDDLDPDMLENFSKLTDGYIDTYHCLEEPQKWYDHPTHMKNISIAYPDYTFVLEGEGEENGDIWIAFYYRGQEVRRKARVVLDKDNPFAYMSQN